MSTFLQYNNIILGIDELIRFHRVPVYDGPQKLYDKVSIHVRGVYNPNATSYAAGGGGAPIAVNGAYPTQTDRSIRFNLSQPRGFLLYVVGNQPLLWSPAILPDNSGTYHCDCKGGPYPTLHNIVEHVGRKTFIVDFSIETYVNEAYTTIAGAPPVVLSHRWVRRQDIDEHFYTTLTTHGHAIFRADILAAYASGAVGLAPAFSDRPITSYALPDDFRNYLFHEVPNGFKRDHAVVTTSEDGFSLEYTIIDRQLDVTFPQGITKVEAYQAISTSTNEIANIAGASWARNLKIASMLSGEAFSTGRVGESDLPIEPSAVAKKLQKQVESLTVGKALDLIGGGALQLVRGAETIYHDAILGKRSVIPMMTVTVQADVWGDYGSRVSDITNTAQLVVANRFAALANNIQALYANETRASIRHSLVNKFVSYRVSKVFPLSFLVIMGGANVDGVPDFSRYMPGVTPGGTLGSDSSVVGSNVLTPSSRQPYPIPNANRAYYFEWLAAQLFLVDAGGTVSPGMPSSTTPVAQNLPTAGG